MAERSKQLEIEATLHTAATSLPTPTAGVTLPAGAFNGNSCLRDWIISVDFSTTATLANAKLCRKHGTAWRAIAELNDGEDIAGESGLGFEQLLHDIGGDPEDEYAVKADNPSAGTVTIKLRPLVTSTGTVPGV